MELLDFSHHHPTEELPMAENAQRVRDIIEKELGVEREKLTDDASFIEDLGADSLDIVELVMEFEKEFNIDIPDEDAEKLRTVGDAIGYLNQKVGSGA
jgi:acyl carrier protein